MDRLGPSVIGQVSSSYLKHCDQPSESRDRSRPCFILTNRSNPGPRRGGGSRSGSEHHPLKHVTIPSPAIPFPTSQQPNMSTHSQHLRSKSSLSITLTEPFVILRTVDNAASPLLGEFAPSSVLRGLLALDLSKASKISSIQIELLATSYASWPEGMSHVHSSFGP